MSIVCVSPALCPVLLETYSQLTVTQYSMDYAAVVIRACELIFGGKKLERHPLTS